jgi:hypothetical protein
MSASPESTPAAGGRRRAPAAAPAGSPLRTPDFFIVGHAKCGTTALYEMLRRHPQICMPSYQAGAGKEPWYFSRDNPQVQDDDVRSIEFTGRNVDETFEDYLGLFAHALPGQRIGEASSSYLWSRVAAGRIAEVQPEAKIVAIFREPASFLRSLHLQLLQNRHEVVTDFRTAVELDDERRENRQIPAISYWPGALIYDDRVKYLEQLRRYEDAFSPDQVLTLIYDDFRADNEKTVKQVLQFLEVDDTVGLSAIEANPTIEVRSERVDRFRQALHAGSGPVLGAVKSTGKALSTARMREAVFYPLQRKLVYREPEKPDEEFMLELRRRYKPEVAAFSDYIGRDLVKLWGYDRI